MSDAIRIVERAVALIEDRPQLLRRWLVAFGSGLADIALDAQELCVAQRAVQILADELVWPKLCPPHRLTPGHRRDRYVGMAYDQARAELRECDQDEPAVTTSTSATG